MGTKERLSSGVVRIAVLAAIVAAYVLAPHVPPPILLRSGYACATVGILVGLCRGGASGYSFWVPVIAAAPIVTPLIVQVGLGLPFFSAYAQALQTPEHMGPPVLFAGLGTIYLAMAINVHPLRPVVADPPAQGIALVPLMGLLGLATVAFAWLTEPGEPLGMATYAELMSQRISGVRFAGGAWLVCALALTYLRFMKSTRERTDVRVIYFISISISLLWLLTHARRSEVAGFALLLFIISTVRRISAWQASLAFVFFIVLAIIGYVRNFQTWSLWAGREYFQLPGGPGNVLLGFLAVVQLSQKGVLQIIPGETYLGQIQRLPPEFLGLPRPETAYQHVEAHVPLIGGEYFLVEPWLNFGIFGVVAFLPFFAAAVNWSTRAVRRSFARADGIYGFLLGGTFLAFLFRTIWYGIGAVIKGVVIAILLAAGLELAVRTGSAVRNRRVALKSAAKLNDGRLGPGQPDPV